MKRIQPQKVVNTKFEGSLPMPINAIVPTFFDDNSAITAKLLWQMEMDLKILVSPMQER